MAVVDFTLEDVRKIVFKDVRKVIDESIDARFGAFDARFTTFENKYDDDMRAIQEDLTVIIKRLDSIEHDAAATRRIVNRHSKDIMHLRAAAEL
jgi:hypothetical protein